MEEICRASIVVRSLIPKDVIFKEACASAGVNRSLTAVM